VEHDTHDHHDEIHLPGPSIAPIIVAGGITLTAVGLINNLPMLIIGVVMLLIGLAIWAFVRG
jgi:hypothetical protein